MEERQSFGWSARTLSWRVAVNRARGSSTVSAGSGSTRPRRLVPNLMALALLSYAVPTASLGESIPANHGLGYDGTVYASIATRFGHLVRPGALDSYDA
jgi:hypothetical protein